jgi:thymidine kinase
MKAPDPNKQRSSLILYIGPMNGGKSETLIKHALNLQDHAHQKVLAFTPNTNTRDGLDKIIGENQKYLPAIALDPNNPQEILKHIEKEKGFVNVIVFDEINLYNDKLIPIINQLKNENRIVMGAGLDKSFRGESFGIMPRLKELAEDSILYFNSYCKMSKNGQQCSNLANYTVRLRKDSDQKVQFFNKKGEIVTGYGYAPYFDPLVLIEGSDKGTAYTTACEECFKIPYKKETIQAYNMLIQNKNNIQITNLDKIVEMLIQEKIIRKDGNKYHPFEYHYDLNSGMAVPKD